jgi:transcription initiation factor TFIIIB Brf1 subunit/transcription initiation factor TFIIB
MISDHMKCKEGKSTARLKPGRYRCKDCGAVVKKKKEVCEPEKTK